MRVQWQEQLRKQYLWTGLIDRDTYEKLVVFITSLLKKHKDYVIGKARSQFLKQSKLL